MNRRGFLAVLSRAPVVGAIAGKMMAEQAAGQMAGISLTGGVVGPSGAPSSTWVNENDPTTSQRQLALRIPGVRAQIESLLYEQERRIGFIDPDIAVMRSFSLNAKIVYQRQRMVARELSLLQEGEWLSPWRRVNKAILRGLGLAW